jgi:hypothetical protein
MASTGFEHHGAPGVPSIRSNEKYAYDETPMARGVDDDEALPHSPGDDDSLKPVLDYTHRKLKPRHIQLIGIGGSDEDSLVLDGKRQEADRWYHIGPLERRCMSRLAMDSFKAGLPRSSWLSPYGESSISSSAVR